MASDGADVTCCGRPFQTRGMATGKAQSSTVDSCVWWTLQYSRYSTVNTVAAQTSRPGLRSADTTNYVQPRTRTKFEERAFSYAGPAVWNLLPDDLRRTPTINSFKQKLKTFYL